MCVWRPIRQIVTYYVVVFDGKRPKKILSVKIRVLCCSKNERMPPSSDTLAPNASLSEEIVQLRVTLDHNIPIEFSVLKSNLMYHIGRRIEDIHMWNETVQIEIREN